MLGYLYRARLGLHSIPLEYTMLRLPQINSQARWPRPDAAAAAAALIAMLRQHVADQ